MISLHSAVARYFSVRLTTAGTLLIGMFSVRRLRCGMRRKSCITIFVLSLELLLS